MPVDMKKKPAEKPSIADHTDNLRKSTLPAPTQDFTVEKAKIEKHYKDILNQKEREIQKLKGTDRVAILEKEKTRLEDKLERMTLDVDSYMDKCED